MGGRLCLLWMFTWTMVSCAPSISTVCPENCECSNVKDGLKVHCSSMEFLGKLKPKQIQEITDLDLSGLQLKKVDHKLRKLKNLKKLNLSNNKIEDLNHFPNIPHLTHLYLSHNNIKFFTASDLPKSVKHIDLSSNRISNITDIPMMLPHLSEINFNDNILSCECDFLKYRNALHLRDVHVVRPASCYSPESVRGISMLSVYCVAGTVTYDDVHSMLKDEPGSGEDIGSIVVASASSNAFGFSTAEDNDAKEDDMEDEYIRAFDTNSSSTESDENMFEGSGTVPYDAMSGGSGEGAFIPISPDPAVPHCYYNCSTPAPVDRNVSAPTASIRHELSIMVNELAGLGTNTTTTPTPVEEEVQETSVDTLSESKPKEEPAGLPTEIDKSRKVNASIDVPKESQTTEDISKNSTTTYIVVAVLFLAMVALIAYVVIKKRSNQRRNNRRPASNHEVKEPPPVEMKPLMTETPPPIKTNNMVPERAPLMNGQNGTNKKSDDDESANDVTDGKAPDTAPALVQNGIDAPAVEEPQMRPKTGEEEDDDALLTPGTKRVTIQAKELSSPKSPVLVHRHLGDDGTMVSSPVSNNEFKYT